MGAADEKCICQICTCGRHRCPRHPQNSFPSLPEIGSVRNQSRRSDNLRLEGSIAARGRSHEDFREFQVQRPLVKKLGSTLRTAGDMDLTSSNHQEYREHPMYRRPILNRLQDNLRQEGEMMTSSRAHEEFKEFSAERPVLQRQKSSLKIGLGQMNQTRSLTSETYTEFQAERPKRNILQDNLRSEGILDATSKTQEDFKEFTVERPVIKKLQDNLSVGTEARLSAHPLSRTDFTEHSYTRPVVKKTADNLKLDGEFSMPTRDTGTELTFERPVIKKLQDNLVVGGASTRLSAKATSKSDFVEHSYSRPSVKKTKDNLTTDGDFFVPTKETRPDLLPPKPVIKKLQDNLHVANGEFQNASTLRSDYRELGPQKVSRAKLGDNLKLEGDIDLLTKNQEVYIPARVEKPEVKKLSAVLTVGGGAFLGNSVQKEDFPLHEVSRPVVQKPAENLNFFHETAISDNHVRSRRSAPDFTDEVLRAKPKEGFSNQLKSSLQVGPGDAPVSMTSTSQDAYNYKSTGERSRLTRPPTSNKIQEWNGDFNENARVGSRRRSSRRLYSSEQTRSISQPPRMNKTAFISSLGIGLSGGQAADEFKSTLRSDYADLKVHEAKARRASRPPTSMHLSGDHDLRSTSKLTYANTDVVQRPFIKSQIKATDSTLSTVLNADKSSFAESSLYKSSFMLPAIDQCPASTLDAPDKSPFAFVREFKNHKFYKPVVSIQHKTRRRYN